MTLKLKDMFVVHDWSQMGQAFYLSYGDGSTRPDWLVRSGRIVEAYATHIMVQWDDDKIVKLTSLQDAELFKLFGARVDADEYATKKRNEYSAEQQRRAIERAENKARREAEAAAAEAAKKKPARRRRTR